MAKKSDGSDTIVSWVEPVATDSMGMVPLVFKTHSPGSVFETGSTVVKYSFGRTPVDTVSCLFTVKVSEGKISVCHSIFNFFLNTCEWKFGDGDHSLIFL